MLDSLRGVTEIIFLNSAFSSECILMNSTFFSLLTDEMRRLPLKRRCEA